MKKVVRLNENDIKKLVTKILKEDSVNEGLFDWVRSKRFSDEETGRAILKGVQEGHAQSIHKYRNRGILSESGYEFNLGGHNIIINYYFAMSPSGHGSDNYSLKIDGQYMDISKSIIKKIMGELSYILSTPERKKREDIKTSLNRYNMSPEERENLENPETYFQ